jgi:hypothetical protein
VSFFILMLGLDNNNNTVKPVYNCHPWDLKIVAIVCWRLLFRGFSIEFDLAGLRLTVVGRWPLLRGGR